MKSHSFTQGHQDLYVPPTKTFLNFIYKSTYRQIYGKEDSRGCILKKLTNIFITYLQEILLHITFFPMLL
jgi:hypothetical protein